MKKFSLFFTALVCMSIGQMAFAQSAGDGGWDFRASAMFASGLAIGLSALGGALGQGRAAATALEGIARNPSAADRIQTPMILGLVFIESLVIYGLVVAILLSLKA